LPFGPSVGARPEGFVKTFQYDGLHGAGRGDIAKDFALSLALGDAIADEVLEGGELIGSL
jgi:hypothetical protein